MCVYVYDPPKFLSIVYTSADCLLFVYSWFDLCDDPDTNTKYHMFNGKYWEYKLKGDWSVCPDIFWKIWTFVCF